MDYSFTLNRIPIRLSHNLWHNQRSAEEMNPVLKVQDAWQTAARELGIQFVCPFSLGNGSETVQYHGMLPGFGSPKGTVFLASSTFKEDIAAASQLATKNGFFFSCISAAAYGSFDRASFLETLKDWGWQSMEGVPPQGFARPVRTEKKRADPDI